MVWSSGLTCNTPVADHYIWCPISLRPYYRRAFQISDYPHSTGFFPFRLRRRNCLRLKTSNTKSPENARTVSTSFYSSSKTQHEISLHIKNYSLFPQKLVDSLRFLFSIPNNKITSQTKSFYLFHFSCVVATEARQRLPFKRENPSFLLTFWKWKKRRIGVSNFIQNTLIAYRCNDGKICMRNGKIVSQITQFHQHVCDC